MSNKTSGVGRGVWINGIEVNSVFSDDEKIYIDAITMMDDFIPNDSLYYDTVYIEITPVSGDSRNIVISREDWVAMLIDQAGPAIIKLLKEQIT